MQAHTLGYVKPLCILHGNTPPAFLFHSLCDDIVIARLVKTGLRFVLTASRQLAGCLRLADLSVSFVCILALSLPASW